ncbi:hypothetical protein HIM_04549 [Hirsutella minnesotensis 3608]|uniref:Uncharacterized protein n=1 Tax=Hirsutella minnesotensis 3608 TaxID=1043627 RepID=A0A0F7ZV69_9HYPO|nr:hypothetical protein HIM_04549 [Hirsutella minnesotensis 3608]
MRVTSASVMGAQAIDGAVGGAVGNVVTGLSALCAALVEKFGSLGGLERSQTCSGNGGSVSPFPVPPSGPIPSCGSKTDFFFSEAGNRERACQSKGFKSCDRFRKDKRGETVRKALGIDNKLGFFPDEVVCEAARELQKKKKGGKISGVPADIFTEKCEGHPPVCILTYKRKKTL